MSKKKAITSVFSKESIATIAINSFGASITFFYFNVIDPIPTTGKSIRPLDTLPSAIFLTILVATFFIGLSWGNKHKKKFREWLNLLNSGEKTPAEVPLNIKRDVLNFPLYASGIAALMWLTASSIAGYLTSSWRFFFGLMGCGGLTAVTLLFFVDSILWRPIIPVFFPDGVLSKTPAVRLPILGRLLIVFLLIGILPPTLLVSLTWQRTQMLLSAPNPETILANLRLLQIFILGASIVASIGLAFFITRGITNPLDELRKAMNKIQNNDIDTKVVVKTNDELGYVSECFNEMTSELHQKEILFNANIQLRSQLAKIKELEAALREQAIRDPLTGLFNRRYMEEILQQELSRASRHHKKISIVILDIDMLKEINDQYGHIDGGDRALICLSEVIGNLCRQEDIFCRYAGDEFVVILYDVSQQVAYKRVQEWKKAICSEEICAGDKTFSISFSAGIAEYPTQGFTVDKVIQKADKALYKAKELGRNEVLVYDPDDTFMDEISSQSKNTILISDS